MDKKKENPNNLGNQEPEELKRLSRKLEFIRANKQSLRIALYFLVLVIPAIVVLINLYYSQQIENLKLKAEMWKDQAQILEKSQVHFETELRKLQTQVNHINDLSENEMSHNIADSSPKNTDPNIELPTEYSISTPLSKTDIRQLAESYDLTKPSKVNPHLKMLEGDISYWHQQGLSLRELKKEFEARRIILKQADRAGRDISTQGDLSAFANEIKGQLMSKK